MFCNAALFIVLVLRFANIYSGEPYGTWKESWRAMEYAHRAGKIRSLGVSNFKILDLLELEKLAQVPVSVVQNWFDPIHQDLRIRKFCSEKNIRYMGYSTLGNYYSFVVLSILLFFPVLHFLCYSILYHIN